MRNRLSLYRTEVLPRGQKSGNRNEDHQLAHYPTLMGFALASKKPKIISKKTCFFKDSS